MCIFISIVIIIAGCIPSIKTMNSEHAPMKMNSGGKYTQDFLCLVRKKKKMEKVFFSVAITYNHKIRSNPLSPVNMLNRPTQKLNQMKIKSKIRYSNFYAFTTNISEFVAQIILEF